MVLEIQYFADQKNLILLPRKTKNKPASGKNVPLIVWDWNLSPLILAEAWERVKSPFIASETAREIGLERKGRRRVFKHDLVGTSKM